MARTQPTEGKRAKKRRSKSRYDRLLEAMNRAIALLEKLASRPIQSP